MMLDDIDKKVLRENFDDEIISEIDENNLMIIYNYLIKNGVYFAKDLIISSLDLFLLPSEVFMKKFKKLKEVLGYDYVNRLGSDTSLIEIMDRCD